MLKSQIHFDTLTSELKALREIASQCTIVVEGKRDAKTLKELGVTSDFYFISGANRSISALADLLSCKGKEVIILTDFDSKGKQLAAKLIFHLQHSGKKVKVNLDVRRNIMRAFKKQKIGEIEDMKAFIGNV